MANGPSPEPISSEQSKGPKITFALQLTVGLSSVQLPYFNCTSILIKASNQNGGNIYWGTNSNVATGGTTGGMRIPPGGTVSFSTDVSDKYWLISDTAGQTVEIAISTNSPAIAFSGGSGANGNFFNIGTTKTSLQTYEAQLSANGTTVVTAATAYIQSVVITIITAGASSNTISIQDGQATPLNLVNLQSTTGGATNTPTPLNLTAPIKMTSGISIVLATGTAATVNVWISYWQ